MKKTRILTAMLVVLALLVAAIMPATGLAAGTESGMRPRPADDPVASDDPGTGDDTPDDPGTDEPGEPDFATPPSANGPDTVTEQTVEGAATGGTATKAVGVLCSADVTINLHVPAGTDYARYVWKVAANQSSGQAANAIPGAAGDGTLTVDATTVTSGSTLTLKKDDIRNAGASNYICEAQVRDPDNNGSYKTQTTWTFPVTTYGATLTKALPLGNRLEVLVRFDDEHEVADGTLQMNVNKPTIPTGAITVGPTEIQDYYYWYREGLANDTWGRDKTGETTVTLKQDNVDLLAGDWNYVCEGRGVGMDAANSQVKMLVATMAQLRPINDYSDPAKFGLSIDRFTNGIDASDVTEVEGVPTMSVAFEISRQNESVPIGVEWAKGIAPQPQSIRYVWQAQGEEPATRNDRVLLLSVNTARQDVWSCATEIIDDTHFPNGAYWEAPIINVDIRLIANRPEIQGVYMVRGTTMTPPTDHTFTLGQGYDLCLEVTMRNTGDENLEGMSYFWSYFDPETKNTTRINTNGHDFKDENDPLRADFEVVDGGERLWLRNISLKHKESRISIQVRNSQNISSDAGDPNATVTLEVEDRTVSPALTLAVNPSPLNNRVQVREGGSVDFTVTETAGINEKVLTYQWKVADEAGGPHTDISGATESTYTADSLKRRAGESTSSYYYLCTVTNTAGSYSVSTPTTEIQVEVLPQMGTVSFSQPTAEQTYTGEHRLISGNSLEFTVKADTDNNDPVTYQWEMAYGATEHEVRYVAIPQAIDLATSETYNTGLLDAGWYMYRCIAENTANTTMRATSPMFIVEVEQNPDIPIVEYLTERSVGVAEGETARMKIRAHTVTGDPVSYQWRKVDGDSNEIIASGTRSTLTLSRVESAQNDTQYVCRVTNEHTKDIYDTKPFTLHVWNLDDLPVIVTQPVDLRMQRDTVGAVDGKLEIAVASTDSSNFIFSWERWNESTEEWTLADQDPEDFIGEETCSSELRFTGVDSDQGRYRCQVENTDGSPAGATTTSNEVTVVLRDRHVPTITSQPPVKVYTSVGKSATLRVVADIEPAQDISYTWMVTSDGGKNWHNATSANGSGYDTSVFTTVPVQKNNVGRSQLYKCRLQGVEGGVAVETNVSTVIPKNPSPELEVVTGTHLNVTVSATTGERFLTGQDITMVSEILTPQYLQSIFDLSGIRGATVEVTRDGEILEDDTHIGTGCVVTLLDSKGVPLDEVEVVVKGDVLGSGQASVSQLVAMAQQLKGTGRTLRGSYACASDINENGRGCELSDLVSAAKMFRQVAGADAVPTPIPTPEATATPSASPSAR